MQSKLAMRRAGYKSKGSFGQRAPQAARLRSVSARVKRSFAAPARMLSSSSEKKDITPAASNPFGTLAATGSVLLLNGVAQGTTANTRLGRRITMHSLLVKGTVQLAPTTTGASPLRLIVVYDSQANAAAPVATDVLLADVISAPMNLSNSRRFKILFDEVVGCIGTGGPQAAWIERYVKLNHVVEFNTGSAGTIADIQTGSIYMLGYNNGNFGTAFPTASIQTRIRFTDN